MDIIEFKYCFKLKNDQQETFNIQIDAEKLEMINVSHDDLPEWTKLDFHKCPHCPLSSSRHLNCPLAISLVTVINRFESVLSIDEIELEVITEDRRVIVNTTAQKGISSLLGLLFPISGCPHTAFFKPMVRFHLPLATEEDTIFRAAGMYLLAQYFKRDMGESGDLNLNGLKKMYENLHQINLKIAKRLRDATETDSSINAIVMLDVFTHTLSFVIEDHLESIQYLFDPYLSDAHDNNES